MRELGRTVFVQMKKDDAFMADALGMLPRARIYPKVRDANKPPYEAYLGEIFVGTFADIADAVVAICDALRDSGTYSDIHYLMPRSDATLLAYVYDEAEALNSLKEAETS